MQIRDGQFHTASGPIPPACLVQLAAPLDGDELMAAVFVSGHAGRGCMQAKVPAPQLEGLVRPPTYTIETDAGDDTWVIRACVPVANGMATSCSQVLVHFETRPYTNKDGMTIDAVVAVHQGRAIPGETTDGAELAPELAARLQVIRDQYQAVAGNDSLPVETWATHCGAPYYSSRQLTVRTKAGELVESVEGGYEYESNPWRRSHYFDEGQLYFSFVEISALSSYNVRIYYDNEQPVLCKLTLVNGEDRYLGDTDAYTGKLELNVPEVVSCTQDELVSQAVKNDLSMAKQVILRMEQRDFRAYEFKCAQTDSMQ